ncbi:MAG: DUF1492 domain-containing protein [Deltaproteobacteria bacterium]
MNAKEYLSQAFRIDQRINSKLEQVIALRNLAEKTTASYSTERVDGTKQKSPMENAIVKIMDYENEINNDIDQLVDLKIEIHKVIKTVDDPDCQLLLELRYLTFKNWEEIADSMGFTFQWVHSLHQKALRKINLKELIKVDKN